MKSLHRYDGWLLEDNRMSGGPFKEMATMTCAHCSVAVIPNPNRTRARAYCSLCDRFICDGCHAASTEATYQHRSFEQITDMIRSGNWEIFGSPHSPSLVPKGIYNG